jgi:uncharacterized protein YfbU (UPF0304 family)
MMNKQSHKEEESTLIIENSSQLMTLEDFKEPKKFSKTKTKSKLTGIIEENLNLEFQKNLEAENVLPENSEEFLDFLSLKDDFQVSIDNLHKIFRLFN